MTTQYVRSDAVGATFVQDGKDVPPESTVTMTAEAFASVVRDASIQGAAWVARRLQEAAGKGATVEGTISEVTLTNTVIDFDDKGMVVGERTVTRHVKPARQTLIDRDEQGRIIGSHEASGR